MDVKRAEGGLKHVQVREYVRALVAEAEPGSAAPSERELVARFGVARMTVRQALDVLVTEGLLERVPGRGTFVAHPRRRVGRLSSLHRGHEAARAAAGVADAASRVANRPAPASPGRSTSRPVTPSSTGSACAVPTSSIVCVEDAYLNEVLLPGFLQSGMPTSLYDALHERGLRPNWAEDAISADAATADEAALLEIEPGAPVLHLSRRALCGDKVVNVSRTAFRPDRFTMYVQLGDLA